MFRVIADEDGTVSWTIDQAVLIWASSLSVPPRRIPLVILASYSQINFAQYSQHVRLFTLIGAVEE